MGFNFIGAFISGILSFLQQFSTELTFTTNANLQTVTYISCFQIIQLGIHRGRDDAYTMEMLRWWFMQPSLIDKLFDEIVPRLRHTPEPYTYLIRLPKQRLLTYKDPRFERYYHTQIGSLEINGNF